MRVPALLAAALATSAAAALQRPCDILLAGGSPCVAAHALTRALYASYAGPLYSVNRSSDGATLDIGVVAAGGVADAAAQKAFCAGAACVVSRIADQSGRGNHLTISPPGGAWPHPGKPVNASRYPTRLAGADVYAAYFETKMGYRNDKTSGVAKGNDPEVMYMVTSGENVNGGCCFDYGNAETDAHDDGAGTMVRFPPPSQCDASFFVTPPLTIPSPAHPPPRRTPPHPHRVGGDILWHVRHLGQGRRLGSLGHGRPGEWPLGGQRARQQQQPADEFPLCHGHGEGRIEWLRAQGRRRHAGHADDAL